MPVRRIVALDETRRNPAAPGAILGITGSSAALVVAHQAADFALATDHLAGARVHTQHLLCKLLLSKPHRATLVNVLQIAPCSHTIYLLHRNNLCDHFTLQAACTRGG